MGTLLSQPTSGRVGCEAQIGDAVGRKTDPLYSRLTVAIK